MTAVDLSTLGTRKVTRIVVKEVENPDTGLRLMRQTLETIDVVQPILNLEEARLLDAKWDVCTMPGHEGKYMTKAGGRRFFIEPDVYAVLFPPKPPEPPKAPKDKKPNG